MTLRRMVPAGMAAAGLAMVAAAVAGCSAPSSSSSSPAASAAVTASVPATSSAAPATSFASAGSASSAAVNQNAGGGPPGCASRDLKAKVGIAQGAAGSVYQVVDFTNIGTSSCSLYGYPGVALAGGSPVTQIGAPASRSTASAPKLLTLAAGATANALVQITEAENYPASKCGPTPSTYMQIYPPNQTTPIYLAYKSMGCSSTKVKLLTVSVMLAGNGGG